jgi:hypothetical protein
MRVAGIPKAIQDLRQLSDQTGLTAGLPAALPRPWAVTTGAGRVAKDQG